MIRDIEAVGEEFFEWLQGKGYAIRNEQVAGLGSWRVLTNGRFAVTVNNDRGTLSLLVGLHPAEREEDTHSLVYWALCLGLRSVHADEPVSWTPSDEELLARAREDTATARRVLELLPSLPEAKLTVVESCARGRQVEYWREMGLWPSSGPIILRPKDRDDRKP